MNRFALTSRIRSRSFVVMLTLAAFAFLADEAGARVVSVSGTHSSSEVKNTCGKNGGDYFEGGGYYGCSKENCDGKGGECGVACNKSNGKCSGWVPGRQTGKVNVGTVGGTLRAR